MARVTDDHTGVINAVVADTGDHRNQVLTDLAALDLRSYIAEPDRGDCCMRSNHLRQMENQPANREIVVYVLGLLGGGHQRVNTEDIAVRCHELFPDAFSWAKYTQFPDKDIVRVALTDARKAKYGELVTGRAGQNRGLAAKTRRSPVNDGWMLTAAGMSWLDREAGRFESLGQGRVLKGHRQQVLRQLKRVFAHRLWERFEDGESSFSPSIGELADLLRCRVDADGGVWLTRFDDLRQKAAAAGKPSLGRFVDLCQHAYEIQR